MGAVVVLSSGCKWEGELLLLSLKQRAGGRVSEDVFVLQTQARFKEASLVWVGTGHGSAEHLHQLFCLHGKMVKAAFLSELTLWGCMVLCKAAFKHTGSDSCQPVGWSWQKLQTWVSGCQQRRIDDSLGRSTPPQTLGTPVSTYLMELRWQNLWKEGILASLR